MRNRGFTLVELLIAVALGMTLCATAFAAVRLAAQATTSATRLSIQNATMRAGYLAAHEDLDWWTSYDDPDRNWHPLAGANQPFTRLTTAFPLTRNSSDAEGDIGWDDSYRWPASDPRTWLRANLAEKHITAMAFGRYAAFWNTDASPALGDAGANAGGTYGAVTVPHRWLANQAWGLQDCIGYYGFADYMPADTLFACSRPYTTGTGDRGDTNLDGMTMRLVAPGTAFEPGEGTTESPKSLWRLTMPAAYAMPKPSDPGAAMGYFPVGYQGANPNSSVPDGNYTDFVNRTAIDQRLLPLAPSSWPNVTMRGMRFIKTRRFVNLYSVGYTDPVSGEQVKLAFTSYGTSLRGARQQRAAAGGWAAWDDKTGAALAATLDGAAKVHP